MGLFHYKTILEELANTKIKAPLFGTLQKLKPTAAPQKVLQGDSFKNFLFQMASPLKFETMHLCVCIVNK